MGQYLSSDRFIYEGHPWVGPFEGGHEVHLFLSPPLLGGGDQAMQLLLMVLFCVSKSLVVASACIGPKLPTTFLAHRCPIAGSFSLSVVGSSSVHLQLRCTEFKETSLLPRACLSATLGGKKLSSVPYKARVELTGLAGNRRNLPQRERTRTCSPLAT